MLHAAVLGADVADALDGGERGEVQRVSGAAGGELHHVLDADGGDQLARRAERDHLAVIHDGHAVAEALGFVHVVGGEQDGAAGVL